MASRQTTDEFSRLKQDDRVRAKFKQNGKYYDARIVAWQEKNAGYLLEWLDGIGDNRYEHGVPEEAIISKSTHAHLRTQYPVHPTPKGNA